MKKGAFTFNSKGNFVKEDALPSQRQCSLKIQSQEWLTTEEAARYLGVSVGTLRNMTSYGQVTYYKLGRRNRYKLHDLRNLLTKSNLGGTHGS